MLSYLRVPGSVHCLKCKDCGATPVIAPVRDVGYSVKCPDNSSHYHTPPGLIDIERWNHNNAAESIAISSDPIPLFAW